MGAIPQHDIQKDNACRCVINSVLHAFDTFCRIDHRMGFALRIYVIAQIYYDMAVRLKHEAFCLLRRHFQVQGILDQHCCLSGQCSSGIVCLDGLLLLCAKELGIVYIYLSLFDLFSSYQTYCEARSLIQRICMVEVLLVVFWLFA